MQDTIPLLGTVVLAFMISIPCGYLRQNFRKYSFMWFFLIHIPIPFHCAVTGKSRCQLALHPFDPGAARLRVSYWAELSVAGENRMAKRSRMSFPKPLPGLLQESFQTLGLAERLRDAEIWRVWPEVVGAVVAARAQPLRIINGTLTVAVSSAPWMQELRFMTGMMREKLNNCLGSEVVREIVLKAGRVDSTRN